MTNTTTTATASKATETETIDASGSTCFKCRGTRHEYRCYGRVARKRCLSAGCRLVIELDVAADVQRLWNGWTLAQKREWFGLVYG